MRRPPRSRQVRCVWAEEWPADTDRPARCRQPTEKNGGLEKRGCKKDPEAIAKDNRKPRQVASNVADDANAARAHRDSDLRKSGDHIESGERSDSRSALFELAC